MPKEIGDRWTPELLTQFCEKLRAFAKDSRFEEFFTRHAEMYAGPCGQLEAFLKDKADISWFSRFFGVSSPISFRVLVGMNNGGGNYGPRFIDGGRLEIYSILGIGKEDRMGLLRFQRMSFPFLFTSSPIRSPTR